MMPIKAFLGTLALALFWAGPAAAAEIKVLSSNATKTLLEETGPMFERASGHKVTLGFGTSQQVAKRMDAGETADLVVITPEAIEQLTKQGKVAPGTQVEIARSLVGIAVKRGAPKPDIGTPDALRKTLLAAKSVTFSDPKTGATSGVHTAKIFERLGIADQMTPKYVLGDGNSTGPIVARGDAEMAIQQISALKPYPGIDIVGPFPDELQLVTILSAGIGSTGREPETVKAFIGYLSTPEAIAVIRAKGLEPGRRYIDWSWRRRGSQPSGNRANAGRRGRRFRKEGPGRAGPQERGCGPAVALDRQWQDGPQQQRQAGQAVRTLFHRRPPLQRAGRDGRFAHLVLRRRRPTGPHGNA
jgi:molybdate transport system substrate-binding protein